MLSLTPFAVATLSAITPPAATPPANIQAEARIAFADSGGIVDWYARDALGLYLLDRAGRWYYARLAGPCPRLPALASIAFDVGPSGQFDNFSTVVADGLRCRVESVTRTERPAEKGLKGRAR